jgi:hypothetical protein
MNGIFCTPSVVGRIRPEWSHLRNLEKRIIRGGVTRR